MNVILCRGVVRFESRYFLYASCLAGCSSIAFCIFLWRLKWLRTRLCCCLGLGGKIPGLLSLHSNPRLSFRRAQSLSSLERYLDDLLASSAGRPFFCRCWKRLAISHCGVQRTESISFRVGEIAFFGIIQKCP